MGLNHSASIQSFSLPFLENDMDGEALSLAFAAHSCPDCLKDVVSKYGLRLKVYQAIKAELEAERCRVMSAGPCMALIQWFKLITGHAPQIILP